MALKRAVFDGCLADLFGFLFKENGMNIRQDASLGNGNITKKFVQLLIVSDGKLNMTRNDSLLFVVTSGVPSELKNFSSEVLEDSSKVDPSSDSDVISIFSLILNLINIKH